MSIDERKKFEQEFEKEEIDDYIKQDHPDFNLLDII